MPPSSRAIASRLPPKEMGWAPTYASSKLPVNVVADGARAAAMQVADRRPLRGRDTEFGPVDGRAFGVSLVRTQSGDVEDEVEVVV